MRISIIILSVVVGSALTYFMYLFAPNFVHLVDLLLDRVFHVKFGYWWLQHIIFALSIGTIPMISLIPWLIRGHKTISSIVLYNLIACSLLLFFVMIPAGWLIVFSPSKGMFGTIKQPHEEFWNYVLIGGNVLTALIFVIFSLQTRSKQTLKNEILASKHQLDQ